MQMLPDDAVTEWANHPQGGSNIQLPRYVTLFCPYNGCGGVNDFKLDWGTSLHPFLAKTSRRCQRCKEGIFFFMINSRPVSEGATVRRGDYFYYPAPETQAHRPLNLEGIPELEGDFARSYRSVFKSCDAQDWNGVGVHCRRSVEIIVKTNIPLEDYKGNLFADIGTFEKKKGLGQPVVDILHTIRKGGNLGAHFKDKEITKPGALLMIELLNDLVEFLYVARKRSSDLIKKFENLE